MQTYGKHIHLSHACRLCQYLLRVGGADTPPGPCELCVGSADTKLPIGREPAPPCRLRWHTSPPAWVGSADKYSSVGVPARRAGSPWVCRLRPHQQGVVGEDDKSSVGEADKLFMFLYIFHCTIGFIRNLSTFTKNIIQSFKR